MNIFFYVSNHVGSLIGMVNGVLGDKNLPVEVMKFVKGVKVNL